MLILGLICALLLLVSVTLGKVYFRLPLRELKKRARSGDASAKQFYKPAAYGLDLHLLLGGVSLITAALSVLLLSRHLSSWLAFIVVAALVWAAFMWLPASKQSSFSESLAKFLAPSLAKVLHFLHRPLSSLGSLRRSFNVHTDLYSKEDIIDLLELQKSQPDNQISESELTLAKNALSLNDKKVSDILLPAKDVQLVSAAAPISPILIDELHKTGHKTFPVYDGKKTNIVGVLELGDLVAAAKRTIPISTIMRQSVSYVHEDFTLSQFVQAITKAQQHLFIVLNSFEEFVGIVTASDFLNQLLVPGSPDIVEDYENPSAVAEVMKRKEVAAARPADIELTEEHLAEIPVEAEDSTEPEEPEEPSEPEPESPPEI